MSNFLNKTFKVLEKGLTDKSLPKTREVLIGRKFMAVLLENYLGACYGPRTSFPTCNIFDKPGELDEISVIELIEYINSDDLIERAIGIASLNALSQYFIDENKEKYNYYSNFNLLSFLPILPESRVGMVGLIGPFINYLNERVTELIVIEDNPLIPQGKTKQGFFVYRDLDALEDVDILIITGSTVIEHSIEKPLNIAKSANFKVVIGPTSSWIPDVAFALGFNAVCGMKFYEPEKAFRIIMQGGGTQYFSKYADKYTLTKEKIEK
ncbi:MAG: DUF364 domain-containing protein [Candidatus Lokiarchaeota archaeon]|nr:DUF364 domain-containing protein [Candidatus Lokiarchaeota archaeon]